MQDVITSDFSQFNNWYTVAALVAVVIGVVIKDIINYLQKKNDRFTMQAIVVHIQKQSDILDVILQQYSSNIKLDQMETIFDWVFFQANIKVFAMYHDFIDQLHKGVKLTPKDIEDRLTQEITNLYNKDMDNLAKFRYRNVALSEFVDENIVPTIIDFTATAVLTNKDKRNTMNALETLFTSIKLRALKSGREVK